MASAQPNTDTRTQTEIHNSNVLWTARVAWIVFALLNIVMFVYSVGTFTEELRTGCICDSISYVEIRDDGAVIIGPEQDIDNGIEDGDVVLAVNGEPIQPVVDADGMLVDTEPPMRAEIGTTLTLTLQTGTEPPRDLVLPLDPRYFVMRGLSNLGMSVNLSVAYAIAGDVMVMLACVVVAVLIFVRRSNDWMALFASWALMGIGLITAPTFYNVVAPPYTFVDGNFNGFILLYFTFTLTFITLFGLIFPDGQIHPRFSILLAFIVGGWIVFRELGPIRFDSLFINIFNVVLSLVVAWVVVYRYRSYFTAVRRQQSKWFLLGAIIAFIAFAAYPIPAQVFQLTGMEDLRDTIHVLMFTLFRIASLAVPITFAFAALRYRLYDIDLVMNRSLVYGTLTIVLGIVFFAGLYLLHTILKMLLGSEQTTIAAVVSTAVVVGLFNPTRHRLQEIIDKRLFGMRIALNELERLPQSPVIANPGALTGKLIGSYEVREPAGKGGMGEVYKGYHAALNRSVAIKVLPDSLAANAEFRTRFEREAQTVAALRHPNIIEVFDFGQLDNVYYMVMEYIDGQELAEMLRAKKGIPLAEAYPIVQDISAALDYAHEQGIVHRDVKPSNIMLQPVTTTSQNAGRRFRAVLMDFGIAKMAGTTGLTQTGMMGTLDYIAPEQIMSAKTVGHRADLYAFGIIVYQMLTGQLPFRNDNAGATVFAHLSQPAPDPRLIAPDLPDYVSYAIRRAMEKRPEDRFENAGAFVAALRG
jgi:hypothetical protein